jgi:hypothetical protein
MANYSTKNHGVIQGISVVQKSGLEDRFVEYKWGTLHAMEDLERMSRDNGFAFGPLSVDNGALLYFRAVVG